MFHLVLQAGPHPAHQECRQAPKAWEHSYVPWPQIVGNGGNAVSTVGGVGCVAPAAVSRRAWSVQGRQGWQNSQIDSCDKWATNNPQCQGPVTVIAGDGKVILG